MNEIERAIEKKEYIERGAFIEKLKEKITTNYLNLYDEDTLKSTIRLAEKQPAADVEPVVRGEWKEFDADMNAYSCSVCNEPQMFIEGNPEQNEYSFCPYCGAHMERSGEA